VAKEKFGRLSGLAGWPMNASTSPTSETEKGESGHLTLDYALEKSKCFRGVDSTASDIFTQILRDWTTRFSQSVPNRTLRPRTPDFPLVSPSTLRWLCMFTQPSPILEKTKKDVCEQANNNLPFSEPLFIKRPTICRYEEAQHRIPGTRVWQCRNQGQSRPSKPPRTSAR
jgi:hypothetical protein